MLKSHTASRVSRSGSKAMDANSSWKRKAGIKRLGTYNHSARMEEESHMRWQQQQLSMMLAGEAFLH